MNITSISSLLLRNCNLIIHGDINLKNILPCDGKVYFVDFGYSNYDENDKKLSRPVTSDKETTNNGYREFCKAFGQYIPKTNID